MPFKSPFSRSSKTNPPYPPDNPDRSYSRQSQHDRPPYSPDPYQTSFGDSVNYAQQPYGDDQQLPNEYHQQQQPGRPDLILPPDDDSAHQDYQYPPGEEPKKQKRRFFGLSSSRENVSETSSSDHHHHHSKLGLGRKTSVSVRNKKHSPSGSQQELQSPITHGPGQQGPGGPHPDFQEYRNPPIPPPYTRQDHPTGGIYSRENASYTSSRSDDDPPRPPPHQDPQGGQPRYAPYRQPDEGRPTSVWSSNEQEHIPQDYNDHVEGRHQEFDTHGADAPLRSDSKPPPGHQRGPSELNKLSTVPPISRDTSFLRPDPRAPGEPQSGVSPHPMSAASKGSQQVGEMGRQTPPPARQASDLSDQEVGQLIKDYKELREKYSKVKRYYFDKEDQVKALQNTLAHQRLSAQRTTLDDGEYVARLQRLDGLISQLAFGFRKEWKKIPTWLQPHVNKDAITIGKQEMTAVGRAFISRWLVDELFDKYFHPGIEPELSIELKTIQRNIRLYCPPFQTSEEEEALNAKLNSWRLLTMDGLQPKLSLQDSTSRRDALIQKLNKALVEAIQNHMSDPPPAGIEGGVHMIIDLAVGILQHLPTESRDVYIEYFTPGAIFSEANMRVETGIPPLTVPIGNSTTTDKESEGATTTENTSADNVQEDNDSGKGSEDQSKKGFLGGLMGGGSKPRPSAEQSSQKKSSAANSQTSLVNKVERVRMCVFLGLHIRGRMVLAKAPVYTTNA